ncbi:MAG: alanine racemase [Oligoflexia bacterium]|nr:alanine racemase [Oligoflexia bacterium]
MKLESRSGWLREYRARELVAAEEERGDRFLGAPSRVVAEFSSKALRANYLAVREQVPGLAVLPMVKANAYGHGFSWVARELLELPGLYGFGVATLGEAAELRAALGERGKRVRILVLSGACGWTREKGAFCEKFGLTPTIASDADWQEFTGQGWQERIPYELKFNTGLNRLGMSLSEVPRVARFLRELSAERHPTGVLSHLVMSEAPEAKLTLAQLERFTWLRRELREAIPGAQFHLGNSAAIWNQKKLGLTEISDVVRPGLSLYGIAPWDQAPARGITPVCTLRASVLAVHRLKPGESIGYGARYTVTGTKPVYAAILGAGYADGIPRRWSGNMEAQPGPARGKGGKGRGRAAKQGARSEALAAEREEQGSGGYVSLNGCERRFLGAVSMDLCAVTCDADTRVGDWGQFLGPEVDPWAQSRAAGTIPYELLTSISARVQRIYG